MALPVFLWKTYKVHYYKFIIDLYVLYFKRYEAIYFISYARVYRVICKEIHKITGITQRKLVTITFNV